MSRCTAWSGIALYLEHLGTRLGVLGTRLGQVLMVCAFCASGSNHSHVSKEGTGLSNVQEVRRHSHGRVSLHELLSSLIGPAWYIAG